MIDSILKIVYFEPLDVVLEITFFVFSNNINDGDSWRNRTLIMQAINAEIMVMPREHRHCWSKVMEEVAIMVKNPIAAPNWYNIMLYPRLFESDTSAIYMQWDNVDTVLE